MVFTELLAMAEDAIGEDEVDEILDELDLPHGGTYTAVGYYPCSELVQIVGAISDRTGLPGEALQYGFGEWMHKYFVSNYPQMYEGKSSALTMLESIEGEVHKEVRKLYEDVELPTFETEWLGKDTLRMTYRSSRHLTHFCHGLISECLKHYGQTGQIDLEDASTPEEAVTTFTITLAA